MGQLRRARRGHGEAGLSPRAASPLAELLAQWVAGAAYAGIALTLIAPLVAMAAGTAALLVHLCGVAYLAHQVEEHWHDRFRRFANERVLGHADALTTRAVLWINLPGVWGLNLVALAATIMAGAGWGLAAPYLMLVNAIVHIGSAIVLRGYNPGLLTAAVLFVPLGGWCVATLPATATQHAVGIGIAVATHAAIIAHVAFRLRRMR